MSRTKEYYESEFLDMRQEIDSALNQAQSELNFDQFVSRLAYNNKKSRRVLAIIIDRFHELVRQDPGFFLTCDEEALRSCAQRWYHEQS